MHPNPWDSRDRRLNYLRLLNRPSLGVLRDMEKWIASWEGALSPVP